MVEHSNDPVRQGFTGGLCVRIGVALLLIGLFSPAMRATSIEIDETIEDARLIVQQWSFGLRPTRAATDDLLALMGGRGRDERGRAYVLRCLAWVDVYSDEVNLRNALRAFALRWDMPAYVREAAATAEWELRVFGQGLGDTAQMALLRGVMTGRPGGRFVYQASRRWAALELCARGLSDEDILTALAVRAWDAAADEAITCERMLKFIQGPRDVRAVERALTIHDPSDSQVFAIRVIETALGLPGDDGRRFTTTAMARVGGGKPAAMLGTRHIVFDLLAKGASWNDLRQMGVRSEVLSLLVRRGALKYAH